MLFQSRNSLPNLEFPTSWWIRRSEFTMASYINLKSKMSTLDFKKNEVPVAIFDYKMEDTDYVVIPKIKRSLLEFILGRRIMFQKVENNDVGTTIFRKPKFDPLPHQEGILKETLRVWNNPDESDKRVVITIPPGGGKSFSAAYLAWKMKTKFVFVVYSSKLVGQTWENFCDFLGRDGLLVMEKSKDFPDIRWNKVKGLFITHSMLRTLISTYSMEYVVNTLQDKMGVQMAIYDEFDRETGNMYKMSAFTNIPYNLYLTGTPFRSLKEDDQVFQTIFRHSHMLGNDVVLDKKKDLHIVHYKFSPSPKEYTKMQLYDEQLFKTYYNDYIARKDMLLDFIMSTFYKKDDSLIKKMIAEKGQIVVYAGRINNCQIVKEKLVKNFGIDEDSIGVYNSDISDKEKIESEKKTWIISTCESLGRGYDNKNVRVLIYLEFSFSLSTWLQTSSRVARVGGKYGHVIYGLDHSFWKVEANWNKRIRNGTVEEKFNNIYNYEIPEKWNEYYIYGYRKTSDIGIELMSEIQKKQKQLKWSKRI